MRLFYFIVGVFFAIRFVEALIMIGTDSFHADAVAISFFTSLLMFFLLYGNYQNSLKNKNKIAQNSVDATYEDDTVPIDISGESFYQDAIIELLGKPNKDGYDITINGSLIREPDNDHDPNAIKCLIQGNKVGYVNRDDAEGISKHLDAKNITELLVSCEVTGGWYRGSNDSGSFGVVVHVPTRFVD